MDGMTTEGEEGKEKGKVFCFMFRSLQLNKIGCSMSFQVPDMDHRRFTHYILSISLNMFAVPLINSLHLNFPEERERTNERINLD